MDLAYGIAGVLIGGILNGSFVAPMKKMPGWKWENSWLVYSVSGLLVIPWIAALATVPNLSGVLSGASPASIWRVLLFGLGWGVGSVLFGLGIARMGLAVGYGLILGLIAPIGTFLPLIVLHPEQLQTKRGVSLMVGTLIVIGGIALCAVAGKMRETGDTRPRQGFAIGLLICLLAGIFSPMLNFSFAFGGELQQRALAAGASRDAASNAIWPLCLTAGLIANAGYSILLLRRNGTWGLFRGAPGHWLKGGLMGLLQQSAQEWFRWAPVGAGVDAAAIEKLIADRAAAKKEKNFKEADRIRAELTAMGVVIEDSAEGTRWKLAG